MSNKTYAPAVQRDNNSRAIAHNANPQKSRVETQIKGTPVQRFVVRVGYDAGLAASPNDLIANSHKTVKSTADKLESIDADKVNSTKTHDYPTFALSARATTSSDKTPVHLVGHGKPGGQIAGIDAATIATNIISAVKGKNQELEFIKLYSCFGMNDENTEQSSVAKFKSALSSENIINVPVFGAKGLLIPRAVNKAKTDINVNVIPRRYTSAAFAKRETNAYFKSKFVPEMDTTNDGTWEAPKGSAVAIINGIMANVNDISTIPTLLMINNAPAVLPAQQMLDSNPTAGTINYDSVPSGEAGQGDKMGAVTKGAKLSLNTLKGDISSQSTLSGVVSKIDSAISEVDVADNDLKLNINSSKFKGKDLKDILK